MARRDAILRLHKSLLARAEALRKALASELEDLGTSKRRHLAGGDPADAAFDAGNDEVSSQLAQLEARELHQIERALARIEQGVYGLCEICQKRIPVARLNALPYSTTCVNCQREMEQNPDWEYRNEADWEKVSDDLEDREVNLSDLEMDLSRR
ncbi:MAG: hypothetical protein KatS3mg105_3744 [Gemmatales bacterium]|nr:MAG: hypothetical protein KatS3mg105_3744 [Gemmatales bacterium]